MKTISDKIFELLKEKGMSQKEFAQRTGIAERFFPSCVSSDCQERRIQL